MVLSAFAVHLELGLVWIEGKRDGDELVAVMVALASIGDDDAGIAYLHLGPSLLREGVDAEETVAVVRREHGEKVGDEGVRGDRRDISKILEASAGVALVGNHQQ